MKTPALLLVAALLANACSSSTSTTATPNEPVPEGSSTTTADTDALSEHLNWFLTVINGAEVSAAEYEARFDESFRQAVPYESSLLPIVADLQAGAPYELGEISRRSDTGLDAIVTSADSTRLAVILDIDEDDQIIGLLLQPADPPVLEQPPQTLQEAATRLGELGQASLLAAEVVDGACVPIEAVNAESAVPIGSAFKLYVLGALADAIEAGEVAWTDELTITEELKSVPSGQLQNEPAGATVNVREAAELMISISDNTATDLLIDLLGRNEVEAAQTAYGHTQPGLNRPFLTTREWAILKLGPEQQREDYLNADEAGRRAILDGLADVPASSLAGEAFLQPIVPDRLEWFASLNDLCAAHVRLHEKAQVPGLEPVAEILSLNPGFPSDKWDYIGFKGGSEPGLVATSWLVTEGDRTFVLAAAVLDPEQPLDETEAVLLMGAARDLLGSQ